MGCFGGQSGEWGVVDRKRGGGEKGVWWKKRGGGEKGVKS